MSLRAQSTQQTRIPWWAVALPTLAFSGLLLLLSAPAHADSPAADSSVSVFGWIMEVIPGLLRIFL